MNARHALSIATALFLTTFSHAGPPTSWRSVGIGGGGMMMAPAFSPNHADTLYVACDMSQQFVTQDRGRSWNIIPFTAFQTSRYSPPMQFTSDPLVLYTINLAADKRTPVKSTDGGKTWKPLPGDPTGGEVWSLVADSTSTERVVITDYSRLYFSKDGGRSFAKKFDGDNNTGLHVAGAFFDKDLIAVATQAGLLVSRDGGAGFTRSSAGGIPADESMVSFAAAKANGKIRFACITAGAGKVYPGIGGEDNNAYRGIYTLNWGEQGWTRQTNGIPSQTFPFFVRMASNNVDIIYVGGGSEAGVPSLYRSVNGGATWQSVLQTTGNRNIVTGWMGDRGDRNWGYSEFLFGLAVHPSDPDRVAFTDYGYVHISTDGGKLWRQAYVDPSGEHPAGNLTPKGKAYKGIGLENTSCWDVTWIDPKTVWVSFSDISGIRSTDGGSKWAFDYRGHTLNSSYQVARHPGTGTLYMATSSLHDLYQSTYLTDDKIDKGKGGILFSSDKGQSWQPLGKLEMPVIRLTLDPQNPNRLYASAIHSKNGGIYVCDDVTRGASASWKRLSPPPRTEGHPFNIVVLQDGTLVCTYSGRRTKNFTPSSGVFYSKNQGQSWVDCSDPSMHYWTKDLVIDPHDSRQDTWYVAVFSGWGGAANDKGGLFKTTDRGITWTKIFASNRVSSCTVNPQNPAEMYVTTEVEGLWHSANANTARPTFQRVESFTFRQPERVFFNPHAPDEIWVTSFGGGLRIGQATP